MFILANYSEHLVMLRCCECRQYTFVETDKFSTITPDHVILKDDVKICCENCSSKQPQDERYLPLEPQIISDEYVTTPENDLPFWAKPITTEELLRAIIYD